MPIDENTSRVWHVPTDFNTTNLTCAHACQLMFTYHVPGMCLSCSATDQITEVASVLRQTSYLLSDMLLRRNALAASDTILFGD